MGIIAGFGGNMTLPTGMNCKINSFEASLELDTIPVPPAFGESWEFAAPTIARLTGSFAGRLDDNASSTQPFSNPGTGTSWASSFQASITLTASTGCTYVLTVIITNFSLRRAHTGYAEVSGQFRNANGDLAVTWDQTP